MLQLGVWFEPRVCGSRARLPDHYSLGGAERPFLEEKHYNQPVNWVKLCFSLLSHTAPHQHSDSRGKLSKCS